MEKIKREYCYVQKPPHFEIICPKCSGSNLQWSEWENHIWCDDCNDDISGYISPYSGPIPIYTAELLGLDFRRYKIENNG